jgi:hypothetical protein
MLIISFGVIFKTVKAHLRLIPVLECGPESQGRGVPHRLAAAVPRRVQCLVDESRAASAPLAGAAAELLGDDLS